MTDSTQALTDGAGARRSAGALDGVLRRTRRLRVVFVVALYAVLAPFAFGSVWMLSLLWTRDPIRRARRLQRASAGAFRVMHDVVRGFAVLRFDHRGAFHPVPTAPCVVVANHPTRMDISAITAVLGGGCTVVKPEYYGRRWLHPLMVGAWHIEGAGDDPLATGRVIDEAVERLRQGFFVIVFPEGTRSPAAGMLPFGRMAFEIACRAKVPVVSIAVRCDPPWMTKETGLLDPPHPVPRLRLQRLASDDPADVDFDSRVLRQGVELRFRRWADVARCTGERAPDGSPTEP